MSWSIEFSLPGFKVHCLISPSGSAVIVGYLNATSMMKEHEAHAEHIKEENGGELPERVVYRELSFWEKDLGK